MKWVASAFLRCGRWTRANVYRFRSHCRCRCLPLLTAAAAAAVTPLRLYVATVANIVVCKWLHAHSGGCRDVQMMCVRFECSCTKCGCFGTDAGRFWKGVVYPSATCFFSKQNLELNCWYLACRYCHQSRCHCCRCKSCCIVCAGV